VRDLEGIASYLANRDSPAAARRVLGAIDEALKGLGQFPERGRHPPELALLGITRYRETVVAPYRVIYRAETENVYVLLIADARRNMQSLMARRLLGG